MTETIKKVTVIGAGSMGHQIAMLSALGGYDTTLQDIDEGALDRAKKQLESRMEDWVRKEKITEPKKEEAFNLLHMTTSLEEAVFDTDLVIEAVVENLDVKQKVFKELDRLTPKHTILATNSSTIVNSKLAGVTSRPEKVCNMHYFFPPLVMDCIEVVRNEQTSDKTIESVMGYCNGINRTAVLMEKEIHGFIANRILFAINNEALNLYEGGYADYKDIDLVVKKALGHPLGPFALMDLSGNDVCYFAGSELYKATGDPNHKPAKALKEKVDAGHFGRKTGKGWYDYSDKGVHTK